MIYQSLVEEAKKRSRPEHYFDDLYKHDKNRLEGDHPPPVFGWVLRRSGTELLDLRMDKRSLDGYIEHYTYEDPKEDNLYYFFDGAVLNCLPFQDWKKVMKENNIPDREPNMKRYSSY